MAFKSLAEIVEYSKKNSIPFWKSVLDDDCRDSGIKQEAAIKKMEYMWEVMLNTIENYNGKEFSSSGLSGGDGEKFSIYRNKSKTFCGPLVSSMIEVALKTAEANACMHRIVACPTAGSCGVLPSVLIPLFNNHLINKNQCIRAMITAAGIGKIIAMNASISGAEGGCQAEIGSASAMAAGALTQIKGGNPLQIITAVSFALQNLMGLVCDPIGGLVEIPCIKRNVIGCMNAISAADLSLAGISPHIPPDETIAALASVGKLLPDTLKETGQGGLAASPTAKRLWNL